MGASDKVRSSSFVQAISKGNGISTPVAFECGASFRVPVFFTADQDLSTLASEYDTIWTKDVAF
jgi:hypothetical protein